MIRAHPHSTSSSSLITALLDTKRRRLNRRANTHARACAGPERVPEEEARVGQHLGALLQDGLRVLWRQHS